MNKIRNLINEHLNTKCVVVALIITCGGGIIYSLNKTPSLALKKEKFTVEYGKPFNPTFDQLVDTEGLNEEDKHYLQHNVKIKSNIENEVETITNQDGTISQKDRGFARVGDYKITLTYQNEVVTVKVKVKDTVSPELNVPGNPIEIIQGTDLATFDFKSLIIATDLAQLNDVLIDYSTVDVNNPAEYTAKASVEDVNKNKTEKEFKVTVIAPSTDPNVETTTETITDPATGQKKSVVKTKPKTSTNSKPSGGSNSNGSSSSKPSGGNSSGSSSGSGSSGGSSGGSGSSSGSSGGSSGSSGSSGGSSGGSTGGSGSSGGSNGGNSGGNSGDNSSTPTPPKVTIYWAECNRCGKHVESNVSTNDVINKLLSSTCPNSGVGKHTNYNYGAYEK